MRLKKVLKKTYIYILVLILLLFFLFPIYWTVLMSLTGREALRVKNISFIPKNLSLDNYLDLFSRKSREFYVVKALFNSLRVSSVTVIVCVVIGCFSAYAFARLRFKNSTKIFYLLLMTEMLPPISLLIPFYLIFQKLRLLNTWYGLVIGYSSWLLPIVTWILYGYFKSIPKDLEDSARADGCTRVGALFRIVLPISAPGIASAAIVCFMFSMGEFIFAVTMATAQRAHTMPVELTVFLGKFSVEYGKISASAVLAFIFPVLMVLIFQKYIIQGLTKGAVKG
jgi:multiple sugar transport system permease protein